MPEPLSPQDAENLPELKRTARAVRDRRDTTELRAVVGRIAALEGETAWVVEQRTFCDAIDAVQNQSTDPEIALQHAKHLKGSFDFALCARLLELAWNAALEAIPRDAEVIR